jgi:hypothetical protein
MSYPVPNNLFENRNGVMIWKPANGKTGKQNMELYKDVLLFDNFGADIRLSVDLKSSTLVTDLFTKLDDILNKTAIVEMIDNDDLICGWHALKLLQMFGATYTDITKSQLKYVSIDNYLNLLGSQLNPAVDMANNKIAYKDEMNMLGNLFDKLVDKLNNSGITKFTLENMTTDRSTIMTGGAQVNQLKNAMLSYGDSFRTYLNNETPAHFPLLNNQSGGAISLQGEHLEKEKTNKSYKVFEGLWNHLKQILGARIVDPTKTAIETNLTKLKQAEDELITELDKLIVSASLGKDSTDPVGNSGDIAEYVKKYKTVERRQLRIVGALGQLWGYVPQFELQVPAPVTAPYYITN